MAIWTMTIVGAPFLVADVPVPALLLPSGRGDLLASFHFLQHGVKRIGLLIPAASGLTPGERPGSRRLERNPLHF
ncbi:hypothetical protein CG747_35160 [Streptomyces sp. CB02959]|nr:hypothetical protein CG747_35160 [Streptomyces sp. CB02959]